jgi:hypothetical protein
MLDSGMFRYFQLLMVSADRNTVATVSEDRHRFMHITRLVLPAIQCLEP